MEVVRQSRVFSTQAQSKKQCARQAATLLYLFGDLFQDLASPFFSICKCFTQGCKMRTSFCLLLFVARLLKKQPHEVSRQALFPSSKKCRMLRNRNLRWPHGGLVRAKFKDPLWTLLRRNRNFFMQQYLHTQPSVEHRHGLFFIARHLCKSCLLSPAIKVVSGRRIPMEKSPGLSAQEYFFLEDG